MDRVAFSIRCGICEYMNNANKIAHCDESIILLLNCPIGSVFEKTIIPSEFQPVFDFTVEE